MRFHFRNRVSLLYQRDLRGFAGRLLFVLFLASFRSADAAVKPADPGTTAAPQINATAVVGTLFIHEYRVLGAHHLPKIEVERAVYPFLGPGRGPADVEEARAALEKAFQSHGYQTVSVQVPPQNPANGIVVLRVVEATVGRLRVRNSRYFSLSKIKEEAPSLAEGSVPNFDEVSKDIVALNQMPDRRVTPNLKAGVIPGTVDIDLDVQDTFPLHGSVELNNRYSANTTPLRVNASASYNNLWQLDHTIGGSFQIAPEDPNQVQVYSGYYVARFPDCPWLTLIAQGVKQDSNVSTLGSIAVAGKGEIIGGRAIFTLPGETNFYHSFTLGFDYKHFDQITVLSGLTPIYYYPISGNYSATWSDKDSLTVANAGVTLNIRGMGSTPSQFDFNRFNADADFIYLRGDVSHQHDLPGGFQIFGKIQGQVSDQPLVSSEQFAGGGLGTVRGYLEAEELGDDGMCGTLELRSPSFLGKAGDEANEWRIYLFADGGYLHLIEPLPQQDAGFALASFGVGTKVHFLNHFNGSLDAAVPLFTQTVLSRDASGAISQTQTAALDVRLTFRVWAEF